MFCNWFTLGTSPLMAIGCYAKSKVCVEGNEGNKIKLVVLSIEATSLCDLWVMD